MTLSDYLRLPWTVERSDHHDDGEYVALHIRELPGFVVAARTEDEAEGMFWEALQAFLGSYVDAGEEPPTPEAFLPERPQLELIPLRDVPAPSRGSTKYVEDGPGRLRTGASRRSQFATQ